MSENRKTGSRDSGTSQDTITTMDSPAVTESIRSRDPSPRSTTVEYGVYVTVTDTQLRLQLDDSYEMQEWEEGAHLNRWLSDIDKWLEDKRCKENIPVPSSEDTESSLYSEESKSTIDVASLDSEEESEIVSDTSSSEYEESSFEEDGSGDRRLLYEFTPYENRAHGRGEEAAMSWFWLEESNGEYAPDTTNSLPNLSYTEYEFNGGNTEGNQWMWVPSEPHGEYAPGMTNSLPNLTYTEDEFHWGNQEGIQWMWVPSEPHGEYAPGMTNSLPNLTYTEDEFHWGNQEGIQWMWVPSEPHGEYAPGMTNSLPNLTYTEDEFHWGNQEGIQWMWVLSANLLSSTLTNSCFAVLDEPQTIAVPQLSNAGITDDQNSGISHWIGAEEPPEPDNASQRNENHPHPYRKPGFR